MNLEQIVKETVAKIVAEKKGKDLTGDGKIDSKDYLKARSMAIEKAKMKNEGDSEDHEVSMAQNSLNSIIRSAMELKAKIGDQEINIPAWIQDHISNSENYIDQASQGYHEYSNGGHEHEEMNEGIDSKKSSVESASGDTISNIGYDDMDLPIFFSATDDTISYHLGYGGEFEGKIYKYDGKTGKSIEIGDLKHYGDGQNHSADDNMHELQQELDENKMDKEELKQAQIDKAYDHLEKMKENTKLFSKDDIKKAEARIEKLEAELDALAEKSVNEAFDDFTVRRWQHYAGIK
jgi:phage shock protein A